MEKKFIVLLFGGLNQRIELNENVTQPRERSGANQIS